MTMSKESISNLTIAIQFVLAITFIFFPRASREYFSEQSQDAILLLAISSTVLVQWYFRFPVKLGGGTLEGGDKITRTIQLSTGLVIFGWGILIIGRKIFEIYL